MEHYHRHSAWLIDKPRTTVAWNKFASSCFCLPRFQQLAHRAGRSMSALRDDNMYDNSNHICENREWSMISARSPSCEFFQGHAIANSVVSEMTESEFSCFVSLSDDDDDDAQNSAFIEFPRLPSKASNPSLPPKPPVSCDQSRNNRSFVTTGSSFCTASSTSSRHKRVSPMQYNDSYQACVEQFFVVRNRLDSEISALEMESHASGIENEDSSDDDSVGNSPFPLLQHKGSDLPPMSHRKRKPFQPLPPPPPPPVNRHSLTDIPKRGKTKIGLKHKFRRRQSEPPMEMPKQQRTLDSNESEDFLCKNVILEESPLLLPKRHKTNEEFGKKVVVSGWIVVLFGEVGSTHSICSNSAKGNSIGSLSPGFGPQDLYYLRIVQDSSSAALVLHRSTDGRQEHVYSIESSWVVESKESEDRRVGRSISISKQANTFLRLVPVALKNAWRVKLEERIRDSKAEATIASANEAFVLPQHGRFAPDAQLDTARHLFFTIDSFAKQHR